MVKIVPSQQTAPTVFKELLITFTVTLSKFFFQHNSKSATSRIISMRQSEGNSLQYQHTSFLYFLVFRDFLLLAIGFFEEFFHWFWERPSQLNLLQQLALLRAS